MSTYLGHKYSCARDDILDQMSLEGWANKSDGSSEAPTGHFSIIHNTDVELSEVVAAFTPAISALQCDFNPSELVGHFIVTTTESGAVFVAEFDEAHQAEDEFERLVARYDKWLAACPDCDGPRTEAELEAGDVCGRCAKEF